MTFLRKFNGKSERADNTSPLVATYTCPEHGEFDTEVQRDENGEAPDEILCGCNVLAALGSTEVCEQVATWTPSPVPGRVRRFEVVKGKWEKPERPTFLDTRKLGEGQSMEEFREERRKVWDEERKRDWKRFKEGM